MGPADCNTCSQDENVSFPQSNVFLGDNLLDMLDWNRVIGEHIVLNSVLFGPIEIVDQDTTSSNPFGSPRIDSIDCAVRVLVDIVLRSSEALVSL